MSKAESHYICPETKERLYTITSEKGAKLETKSGNSYQVVDGIPDLTYPRVLQYSDVHVRNFYDNRVDAYDQFLPLTFFTHNEDEREVRQGFIDGLELLPGNRVLDIACGTGRDSELIADRLGEKGEIFLQDISPLMLRRCVDRLSKHKMLKEFCVSNAVHLPYPDDYFDATYSFGGLGEFSDIKASLAEMVRVTRQGGKIVVGDESIPIWLRDTEFAKILATTNPQFMAELPLSDIPVDAREVSVKWVIGGVFYLIEFRVGKGEPTANFDFDIPGPRGGTYRTRYEGQLEGVTPETKELAYKAIAKKDISMHEWLDGIVHEAAKSVIDE